MVVQGVKMVRATRSRSARSAGRHHGEGGAARASPTSRISTRRRQADAGRVQVPRGWPQGALRQALRRDHRSLSEVTMPGCSEHYREIVCRELQEEFGYKNAHAGAAARQDRHQHGRRRRRSRTPRSSTNAHGRADQASAGQKPVVTKARSRSPTSSCARACRSAARSRCAGERMYEFLDRLINVALPRVRDFRGVSPKSFDGRGNYAIGLREQIIFPEINFDEDRRDPGHGHHHLHDGEDRRRGQGAARGLRACRSAK